MSKVEDENVVPEIRVFFVAHVHRGVNVGVSEVIGDLRQAGVPAKRVFTLERN